MGVKWFYEFLLGISSVFPSRLHDCSYAIICKKNSYSHWFINV